jgi:dienelactone hydrolase
MRPLVVFVFLLSPCLAAQAIATETLVPAELQRWLQPQEWARDRDEPVIRLGQPSEFDAQHVFAPCVLRDAQDFRLWYCGSRGTVAQRVFELGLAVSRDGRQFQKLADNPVHRFGDGRHSILTPAILRDGDGWRMWFAATDFADGSGLHTLHTCTSHDGIHWSDPSPSLLSHVYAPTVIKTGRNYRMWFTRVGQNPWVICHATSQDGLTWRVAPDPVLNIDQPWELDRLFYPTVVRQDGLYLMWYGSYWKDARPAQKTALGFAASLDGIRWYKHPSNPVFRPEPKRDWESHYVTSQSVMRLDDGTWRMWYASRTKPPFDHKYFAIGTAVWSGPTASAARDEQAALDPKLDQAAFSAAQDQWRDRLRRQLGIPRTRVSLEPEPRGQIELDDVVIEKWVFTSEPGSRVPALLYRPKEPGGRVPAIVLTYGHGGSKSTWEHQYAGQLYAKMGLACLAIDPLGEEERNLRGGMGTRAHDDAQADAQAARAGRLIMGKLVFDAMRGIDFLQQRADIDPQRVGVAGYSLGGATGAWVTMLDPRVKLSLVCGWAFDDITLRTKLCTRVPNVLLREQLTWPEYVSLAAPHCALLVMNGDADSVIDTDRDDSAWRGTRSTMRAVEPIFSRNGESEKARTWFEPNAGHRPYFLDKAALEWIHKYFGTPRFSLAQIQSLPTVQAGTWLDTYGVKLERLYGTELHWRGATLPEVGARYRQPEELSVLRSTEAGQPDFTLEGWLSVVTKQ